MNTKLSTAAYIRLPILMSPLPPLRDAYDTIWEWFYCTCGDLIPIPVYRMFESKLIPGLTGGSLEDTVDTIATVLATYSEPELHRLLLALEAGGVKHKPYTTATLTYLKAVSLHPHYPIYRTLT